MFDLWQMDGRITPQRHSISWGDDGCILITGCDLPLAVSRQGIRGRAYHQWVLLSATAVLCKATFVISTTRKRRRSLSLPNEILMVNRRLIK